MAPPSQRMQRRPEGLATRVGDHRRGAIVHARSVEHAVILAAHRLATWLRAGSIGDGTVIERARRMGVRR